MSQEPELGFHHRFESGNSARTLLLLHGTGGSEDDLLPLGAALDPTASLLSPRGQVLENGMPRFFRRLAEGVFDEADLVVRARELASFLGKAAAHYQFNPAKLVAVGYSNGANIAGAILLLHPGVLQAAALWRPMVPLVPDPLPDLHGTRTLIAAGGLDPIVPASNVQALQTLLRRAGAEVKEHLEPSAGHGLTQATVDVTREWLSTLRD